MCWYGEPTGIAKNTINDGVVGYSGSTWVSHSRLFRLVMQPDGNLVLYNSAGAPLWNSGTWGNPGAFLTLQEDGNMVIYPSSGRPLWASMTFGPDNMLVVQDDRNLVIYSGDGQVKWSIL